MLTFNFSFLSHGHNNGENHIYTQKNQDEILTAVKKNIHTQKRENNGYSYRKKNNYVIAYPFRQSA